MASRSRWLTFGALGSLLILCVGLWAVLGPPAETVAPEASTEEDPVPAGSKSTEKKPPPAGVAPISGRVVDAAGEPAVPAAVTAYLLADDGWRVGPDNPPEGLTQTDVEGRFTLSLSPGVYLLLARAGGTRGIRPVLHVPVAPGREVMIRLLPSAPISGIVVDETRVPVADAVVTTSLGGVVRRYFTAAGLPPPELLDRLESRTDGSGRFELSPLPMGQYTLSATAPGYVRRVDPIVCAPAEGLEIMIHRGRSLRGEVRWPGEDAPEKIRIRLEPQGIETVAKPAPGGFASFELTGALPGRHRIFAIAGGFADARAEVLISEGREPTAARLALERGVRLSGKVLSSGTGTPAAGAEVVLSRVWRGIESSEVEFRRRLRTNADGTWECRLAPGFWMVWAEAEGYREPSRLSWRSRPDRFDWQGEPRSDYVVLMESSPVRRDIELVPEYEVTGRVSYPDGLPAWWVGLEVTGLGTGFTDLGGRFRITGVSPPSEIELQLRRTRVLRAGLSFPEGSRKLRVNATIDRFPRGVVRGQVVTPNGEPASHALVLVGPEAVEADPDGRFEHLVYAGMRPVVRYVLPGYALGTHRGVDVTPEGVQELPPLVLRPRDRVLAGMVVGPKRVPIPGARVRVRFADAYRDSVTFTDQSGRFEVFGPGEWREQAVVEVSAPGFEKARLEERLSGGSEFAPLTLQPFSTVRGRIAYEGRRPRHARLTAADERYRHSSPPRFLQATLAPDGRSFAFDRASAGRYRLRLFVEGFAVEDLGVHEVGPGESVDVGMVSLEAGGSIIGRVTPPPTDWMDDAVNLPECGLETRCDEGGRFRFDHVPAGVHTLTIGPSYRQHHELPVGVESGKTTEVELHR